MATAMPLVENSQYCSILRLLQLLLPHEFQSLEFESAFRCAQEYGYIIGGEDDVETTLNLTSDGVLKLNAEGLAHCEPTTMLSYWTMGLLKLRKQAVVQRLSDPEPYYIALRDYLDYINGGVCSGAALTDFKAWKALRTWWPIIWVSDAYLGDYGYLARNGEFVPLGNILTLLDGDPLFAGATCEYRPQEREPAVQGNFRDWGFDRRVNLTQECIDAYYDRIFALAREHGIEVYELILVREYFQFASLQFREGGPLGQGLDDGAPCLIHGEEPDVVEVYFHPFYESVPHIDDHRWGYWSLDPEPCPGPWPDISLPGIKLTQEIHRWAHGEQLSIVEAELFAYLSGEESQRYQAEDDEFSSSRFEETSQDVHLPPIVIM